MSKQLNRAAQQLGRKGGRARAEAMTEAERAAVARAGGRARWRGISIQQRRSLMRAVRKGKTAGGSER